MTTPGNFRIKRLYAEIERLQGLPTTTFPWWMERLRRGEVIHVTRVADLPAEANAEREILEAQVHDKPEDSSLASRNHLPPDIYGHVSRRLRRSALEVERYGSGAYLDPTRTVKG